MKLSRKRTALVGALLVLAGALSGLAVALIPAAAWGLAGAVAALLLLLAPAHLRIGATVLAAVSSRLLAATGVFPEMVNFFHFPLALLTAAAAALETRRHSPLRRALGFGLAGLLTLSFLSWAINGGQLIRPLAVWLVFAEPFLLIYALAAGARDPRELRTLGMLALAIPFVQLPLMVYQALSMGVSDSVQGLFPGLSAGAHVAGAVTLVGSLICLAKAIVTGTTKARALWMLGGSLLFVAAVLADAKQVIIAFFPALALMLLSLLKLSWIRAVAAMPVLAAVILGAFSYYRPLQMLLDWSLISNGILNKAQAFAVISGRLSAGAGRWLFGLGPGNSISRVALMGLEGYIKPASPVALLGLQPAHTTLELWSLASANWLFYGSSVWSAVSSWLGLLGDLGLLGCGLYLWMSWNAWCELKPAAGWQARVARAVLLMLGLLGFMFSWLEEPGFTLYAALLVGLGLAEGRE